MLCITNVLPFGHEQRETNYLREANPDFYGGSIYSNYLILFDCMKDRYRDGDDFETPEQLRPCPISGKFKTIILDDEQNEFEIELDYSYTEFMGDTANMECSVRPLGAYTMTTDSFKESVQNAFYDETGERIDTKDIIILT